MATVPLELQKRASLARYGKLLGLLTACWGVAEAGLSLWGASRTGSVSLAGFGFDSAIEVVSAVAVWWRMSQEMNHERRHQAERVSLTITGCCLFLLGAYVFADASLHLYRHEQAAVGRVGLIVTSVALVCMPWLSREKRRVGSLLSSRAMVTDAKQSNFCAYLAAVGLLGLLCRSLLGIAWADGVAALVLVPFLFRAGWLALHGEHHCDHCTLHLHKCASVM